MVKANIAWVCFGAVFLAACGGRVAQPVAVTNSYDAQLSCAHLAAEKSNIAFRKTELLGEREESVRDNLGLLLVSPFFLDLKNTEKAEAQALIVRDQRLDELIQAAHCALGSTMAAQQVSPDPDS